MPSNFAAVLLIALFITFVVASPAPIPSYARKDKRSFKVERFRNKAFVGHNGPKQLYKSLVKFGMPIPDGLMETLASMNQAKAAMKAARAGASNSTSSASNPTAAATNGTSSASNSTAGSGKVAATPEPMDVEYLSPVKIGGQTINMDFDSGSSDLWVFNTQLPAASQQGHQVFDSSKSTTFKLMQGATYSISYGDGSGSAGNVGTDTVNIGGATVTSQAIEMATTVSASFIEDTQSNGLVGLAYSKLNTVKPTTQKTFFANAMPSLKMPVFTADLRPAAVGAYEFGNIDTTKFNGSLNWADVNTTNGFWQFSSSKFQVANGPMMTAAGGQAIADTGTTLLLVNPAAVNAYYSQVEGAVNNATVGGVTFPCSSNLPDMKLDIGGNYMAVISGKLINFAKVDSQTCFGGMQATPTNLQIYGDILFKSQFVVFNGGNNSIAMAPHGPF